uniref:Si:ch211-151o1.4 n=1 Tax=Oryzias latipes TaxID=8090 RepID=A0A3P9LEJ9_ORYLA
MDLRTRLEHSEKDWMKEKAELLERFDMERQEWESQLRDMQKKIEDVRINNDNLKLELQEQLRCRGPWQQDSGTGNKGAVDATERDAFCHGVPGCNGPHDSKSSAKGVDDGLHGNAAGGGLIYHSDKKQNATALNAALNEIARVSEELCSYQEEIRKKSGNRSNSCLQEDEAPYDFSQIYNELRALEKEKWLTLSPENTWKSSRGLSKSQGTNIADLDSYRKMQTCSVVHPEVDMEAPPVPPRSSSWNLTTVDGDLELYIPESPQATLQKCHSPCVLIDRKCSSPSIVRKFEAMLQENEGKVFKDGVVVSCSVPGNSNCNVGCCHNRWSCDPSKFTRSNLSAYDSVQKSFSEINILSAGKSFHLDCSSSDTKLQMLPAVRELPVDLLLTSLQMPPVHPDLHGSRRNIMLEKKTAEFNRTLFQAEMGHGADASDSEDFSSPVNKKPEYLMEEGRNEDPNQDKSQSIRAADPHQQSPAKSKQKHRTQQRHLSRPPYQSDSIRLVPRMMSDHPWKPLTLAAYPRPEGSRSNYGAVERILKNYESAARAQHNESHQSEMGPCPNFLFRQEEIISEQDLQDPPAVGQLQTSHTLQTQLSIHSTTGVRELTERTLVASPFSQKNFSRPACPANRRLPSRWAIRLPTSSSSNTSSPSTTLVAPPAYPLQKNPSSFTYTHAFHIDTVIIRPPCH